MAAKRGHAPRNKQGVGAYRLNGANDATPKAAPAASTRRGGEVDVRYAVARLVVAGVVHLRTVLPIGIPRAAKEA